MARILVVEDEPDIVLGLRDDLSRQGYDVDGLCRGRVKFQSSGGF
jgi:DNA-binding response OmpR family regulator